MPGNGAVLPGAARPGGAEPYDPGPGSTARLADRYRTGAPHAAAWSPAIDLMLQHRSVRAYADRSVPPGTLEALVAAAQSAATSSNLQTWSVVAVQDQARRDRLAELAGGQRHIRQAPLFLVWLADLSRAKRVGESTGQAMDALPFMEPFLVAVIDAALAAQNATVAAESLGLGTVYIGALRNHPEAVAAELGLPPGAVAVFGLCVGFADPEAAPAAVKPRLPQPGVLHRETYDPTDETGIVASYDATLQAFQAEQAMSAQRWTDLVANRLGPVAAMSGRDRLREALVALGFGLR